MADEVYVIDQLVTEATISISDDGTGTDTLRVDGLYNEVVQFNLAWSSDAFGPVSASGIYYTFNGTGFEGHRLIVDGVIENAVGTNGRDFIQGNILANLIYGDALAAGAGLGDTLWGGAGNDTIHGGAGDDNILGDNDDDRLFGNAGADIISGGGGIDTVEGGAGADTLAGGSSNGDTLSYATSAAGVQVTVEFGTTTLGAGGDAAGDHVTGFTHVTGSTFGDRIEDLGKGTLAFGYNDNVFSGGAGSDRLILGGGNDQGYGGGGNDFLTGEVGKDLLNGGTGNDELRSGSGQDTLTGGAGLDRFVFKSANDSTAAPAQRDTITDFRSADGDRIDLDALDAQTGVAGNQDFQFITTGFTGAKGELRAKVSGSDLIVMADMNGDKVADFAILLLGVASVTALDFDL